MDSEGDWVAELSCYHNQHVRHRPPFQERAWVIEPEGRADRIGSPLECTLCDRAEMPEGLVQLARLGPWDRGSVPDALRRAHHTPAGRWGLLEVQEGALGFQFRPEGDPPGPVLRLEAGQSQAIPPDVEHRVVADRAVRVELQLWGREETAGSR